jgi:hypothetical protein
MQRADQVHSGHPLLILEDSGEVGDGTAQRPVPQDLSGLGQGVAKVILDSFTNYVYNDSKINSFAKHKIIFASYNTNLFLK